MTVFEKIKSTNIDELVNWLNKNEESNYSSWYEWWNKKYCNKCEPELADYNGREMEFGWCELHNKCKYFQEQKDIPDNKQIIKMWLESEGEL